MKVGCHRRGVGRRTAPGGTGVRLLRRPIMKYYRLRKCLSYNRYLNILIGGRGIGKTYQLKKYVIEQYLKSKKQFVWVRRYKTEIKETTDGFFTKHKNNYPDHKFEIKGKTAYIDGEQAGRFIALTNADILKGSDDFQQ